jgi:MFS family permease
LSTDASASNPAAGTGATADADQAAKLTFGRDFAKLWTSSTSSAIGDGVALAAAPLMASTLTSNPQLIAGVTTALTLPYAILGLPVGVLVDRLDRRRTMAIIDFIRGCILLAFTLIVAVGKARLAALYGCFFLVGAFDTFFRNATQAVTPFVVPRSLLATANARLGAAETVAVSFLGPLCGAAMFVLATSLPFGVDAASFFVSSLMLSRLRLRTPQPGRAPAAPGEKPQPILGGLMKDIGIGIKWLWHHSLLLNLNVISGLANLVLSGALAVLVVYTHRVLGLGALGYGVLLACEAVGAVAAARYSLSLIDRIGREWTLVVVGLIQLAAFLALWLLRWDWSAGLAMVVSGYGTVTFNVVVLALRQTLIPTELQGRVNSMYRLVAWGSIPIGATLAGLIADTLGPPRVYALGSIVILLFTIRLIVGARRQWITRLLEAADDDAH